MTRFGGWGAISGACFLSIIFNAQFLLLSTDGNNMANNVAAKVENAIKQKATQEEILELLKEIPDEEAEQQLNPLRVYI